DRTSDSSLTTASSAEFKKPRVVRERNATDVAVSMTRQQSETSRPNLDRLSQGNSRDSLNHAKPDSPETQSDEGLDQRFRRRPREQDQRRPQSSQATLTSRRTIQIVKRLTSIAEAEGDFDEEPSARKWVQQIDQLLSQVEAGLTDLIDHQIADADRSEQFKRLDEGLGQVEDIVATIREVTKDNEFTFVGLQMLDLSRDHVTPARDRVFNGIRNPNAGKASPEFARGHIRRARNKLAALLKQVDAVARERKLADAIDETVEIYRVYIEKRHRLMRQARQNKHPLPRKLGIIEVDQAYLDRYAEVLRLRRDMLDEFSTMLGDDPRLLSRYMDLIQRRRRSLREQLADIADAQDEVMIETAGWLEIDPEQRPDFWTIISEMRLQVADELIENMAESTERIKKQLPLSLDIDRGTPRDILQLIETIQSVTPDGMTVGSSDGETMAQPCVDWIAQLNAKLTQLEFEYEQNDDVADFVAPRLVETTLLMQEAAAWARIADQLHLESYSGLVAIDQQQLATTSQLFLTETMSIGDELEREFQRIAELEVPDTILKLVSDFQQLVQDIVFNQAAAAYAASMNDLDAAAQQQALAMTNIEAAEASFDQFRRGVVDFLDSYDMRDPNIADLRDPTLDEFLARLEREPNIARQLGIPRRRSNLKVIADSMLWSQMEGQLLSASGNAARQRAKQARRKREASNNANANSKRAAKAKQDAPLTEEQRDELEKARKLQENLEKQLLAMRKKMDDPETPRGQRDALKKVADEMKTMLDRSAGQASATLAWQQLAQTDQAKAVMRAMERGDEVPDEQWNELFSRLGDGLWQVRGKQPPEIYRKAIEQYQDRLRVLLGRQAVGS
ncbi:MAG: cell envelope integrity protein TolA, partial [Planctomycetota bacterium]